MAVQELFSCTRWAVFLMTEFQITGQEILKHMARQVITFGAVGGNCSKCKAFWSIVDTTTSVGCDEKSLRPFHCQIPTSDSFFRLCSPAKAQGITLLVGVLCRRLLRHHIVGQISFFKYPVRC